MVGVGSIAKPRCVAIAEQIEFTALGGGGENGAVGTTSTDTFTTTQIDALVAEGLFSI